MRRMRIFLLFVFGAICLAGVYRCHKSGAVPFDRRIRGPRTRESDPGLYWAMMALYGVGGAGMLVWGMASLIVRA
jgi:hypothetical protein